MTEPTEGSIFDEPEFADFARHVHDELVPKVNQSAATISVVTGGLDAKFAVELGVSIMLDKPIIAVVLPGAEIPEKLARVCDEIVEGDPRADNTANRLHEALNRVFAKLGDAEVAGDNDD